TPSGESRPKYNHSRSTEQRAAAQSAGRLLRPDCGGVSPPLPRRARNQICWKRHPLLFSRNQGTELTVQIGVNGHSMFASGAYRQINDEDVFKTLAAHKLKRYRLTIPLAADTDPWVATRFTSIVGLAANYGVTLEPVLALPLMWGDKTDAGKYPAGDAAAIHSQGYNRTLAFVRQFASSVGDWELGNEINLTVRDANGSPLFGKGWTSAEFAAYPSMVDFANLLRGMSDAIEQVRRDTGRNLRRIVGTTSTMFGYIDLMKANGVKVDVLGYHYYEHAGVNPTNYWGGVRPNFNLFTKLSSYGVPVAINEMNGAEIYDSTFVNTSTSASMSACNSNLDAMLARFSQYSFIEWIDLYELIDEPDKTGPDGRFGLMFNLSTPKPLMSTV
ncbi:hypothetical protein, partial [Bradyrhizobium sp. 151]|uniref:hypothetical protein n=1 Tax=Bradyrhizobium sp. 151 TaxID=2782626 RepID=UPI001FFB0C00